MRKPQTPKEDWVVLKLTHSNRSIWLGPHITRLKKSTFELKVGSLRIKRTIEEISHEKKRSFRQFFFSLAYFLIRSLLTGEITLRAIFEEIQKFIEKT